MPSLSDVACQYATDWVLVKYRWNLAIDTTESDALKSIVTGSCGATVVTVPAKVGTATAGSSVERIWGADRYATAVAISGQYQTGVNVVYVAAGTNFPDGLSAAPAAASQGGPLLLTATTSLPTIVRNRIISLTPALIVVVGGTRAVSAAVYNQLATLAPAIRRDSGADRYETSRVINQRAFSGGPHTAFFAAGTNFPDALSASGAAGGIDGPVILVRSGATTLDAATRTLITTLGFSSAKIAGGTGVVTSQFESSLRSLLGTVNVKRLAGADRYATSSAINRGSFTSAPTVYFAAGTGFADALGGAALAGRDHAPLYVVPSTCVPAYIVSDLQALGTTHRVLLAGTGVLSAGVANLTPCPVPRLPNASPKARADAAQSPRQCR